MSIVDVDGPSQYDILETTPKSVRTSNPTFAIIKQTVNYSGVGTGYEILIPDAGEAAVARNLLKLLRRQERESRVSNNERESAWLESLKDPHSFMRADRSEPRICYCGNDVDNEIHVEESERDNSL